MACHGPTIEADFAVKVRVECYSGYKANERPIRFFLGEERLTVTELLDRWYGENNEYFKLLADDGGTYLLKYDRFQDGWELTMYSAPRFQNRDDPPANAPF